MMAKIITVKMCVAKANVCGDEKHEMDKINSACGLIKVMSQLCSKCIRDFLKFYILAISCYSPVCLYYAALEI